MNTICIAGRIGQDAELRALPSGKAVCNFDVAVKDGKDKTLWVRCALWGDRAGRLAEYLTKGQAVAVSGSLRAPEVWLNKESGEPRGSNSIFVDRVTFTGGSEDRHASQDAPKSPDPVVAHSDTDDGDDIPF